MSPPRGWALVRTGVAEQAGVMAAAVTINDVLDGHVDLDVECLDRIYLNGYVPNLQVGGQVVSFMTAHLGNPIPSPAIMEKIGTAFRTAVDRFAADNRIPVVRFGKDDRKIDRDAAVSGSAGARPAAAGWPRSGSRRSSRTCSPRRNAWAATGFRGFRSPRRTGG